MHADGMLLSNAADPEDYNRDLSLVFQDLVWALGCDACMSVGRFKLRKYEKRKEWHLQLVSINRL